MPKTKPKPTKKKKFTIHLTAQADLKLRQMAGASGLKYTQVFHIALDLLRIYTETHEQGGELIKEINEQRTAIELGQITPR